MGKRLVDWFVEPNKLFVSVGALPKQCPNLLNSFFSFAWSFFFRLRHRRLRRRQSLSPYCSLPPSNALSPSRRGKHLFLLCHHATNPSPRSIHFRVSLPLSVFIRRRRRRKRQCQKWMVVGGRRQIQSDVFTRSADQATGIWITSGFTSFVELTYKGTC